MKTDSIFYELFQTDPSILCELLNNPDPRISGYSFASQEVKQTSFRFDGILLPPLRLTDLPVVFIEAQAQKDSKGTLYSSFFSEIFLYLHDYQPINDWQSLLIFTRRSLDPGLPKQYDDFASSIRFQRIYLDELDDIESLPLNMSLLKLVVEPKSSASTAGRRLVNRIRIEVSDADKQENLVQLVATTLVYKYTDQNRAEIEAMLGISDLRNTRVFQEAKEEGIEQGIEQGIKQDRIENIPFMLESGISLDQMATRWKLQRTDIEDLAITSLKNINTPDPDIAQQLNLTLSRVQQVSHK